MKKLLFVFTMFMAVSLVSCKTSGPSIEGSWVQPIPGQPGVQGFTLEKGGKASSVNMATLVWEGWKRDGDRLTLRGKSIGNGQEIVLDQEMTITKLTADTLILNENGSDFIFTRGK